MHSCVRAYAATRARISKSVALTVALIAMRLCKGGNEGPSGGSVGERAKSKSEGQCSGEFVLSRESE